MEIYPPLAKPLRPPSEEFRAHFVARNQERLESTWNGGDWRRAPWFLADDGNDGLFRRWGMPPHRRRKAAAGLAKLFPPEFCASQLLSGKNALVPLLLLQRTWPGQIMPLLEIGLDASDAACWSDEVLINKLRSDEHLPGAAWELALWANLRRGRYRFEREPTVPGRGSRPDFRVRLGGVPFWVEAKRLSSGVHDALQADVDHAAIWLLDLLTQPGRRIVLAGTEALTSLAELSENHEAARGVIPKLLRSAREALGELTAAGSPTGNHPVGDMAVIRIEPAEPPHDRSCSIELVPGATPERNAKRLVRMVREGAQQMDGSQRGMIAVDPCGLVPPPLLAQALHEAAVAAPDQFLTLRAVVARFRIGSVDSKPRCVRSTILMPGVAEAPWDFRFAEDLVARG